MAFFCIVIVGKKFIHNVFISFYQVNKNRILLLHPAFQPKEQVDNKYKYLYPGLGNVNQYEIMI